MSDYDRNWLNQSDLLDLLQEEHGISRRWARDILGTFLRSIGGSLAMDKKVMIRNFGTFERRESHGKVRPKFDASKNLVKKYGDKELVKEIFEEKEEN